MQPLMLLIVRAFHTTLQPSSFLSTDTTVLFSLGSGNSSTPMIAMLAMNSVATLLTLLCTWVAVVLAGTVTLGMVATLLLPSSCSMSKDTLQLSWLVTQGTGR